MEAINTLWPPFLNKTETSLSIHALLKAQKWKDKPRGICISRTLRQHKTQQKRRSFLCVLYANPMHLHRNTINTGCLYFCLGRLFMPVHSLDPGCTWPWDSELSKQCGGQGKHSTTKSHLQPQNLHVLSTYLVQSKCQVLYMCDHISFSPPQDSGLTHPMFIYEKTKVRSQLAEGHCSKLQNNNKRLDLGTRGHSRSFSPSKVTPWDTMFFPGHRPSLWWLLCLFLWVPTPATCWPSLHPAGQLRNNIFNLVFSLLTKGLIW